MRSKREGVGVEGARSGKIFPTPFSARKNFSFGRESLSRFETFAAYVRALLGAEDVKGTKRRSVDRLGARSAPMPSFNPIAATSPILIVKMFSSRLLTGCYLRDLGNNGYVKCKWLIISLV